MQKLLVGMASGLAVVFGAVAAQAAPLHDNFADAFELTGIALTTSDSSEDATSQTNEPRHFGSGNTFGDASVWFKWTAPIAGSFVLNTAGSKQLANPGDDMDTALAVYTGTSVSALTEIVRNDDDGALVTSKATFTAIAGTTYYIAVDELFGLGGNYKLEIAPAAAPANDAFASAQALFTTGNPSALSGSTSFHGVNATAEASEPAHGSAAPAANTVWFDWVAPAPTNDGFGTDITSYTFEVTGGGASALRVAVYTGNSLGSLTALTATSVSVTNGLNVEVVEGTTYKVAVDVPPGHGLMRLGWLPEADGFFDVTAYGPDLVTAVLPNVRSVQVGKLATGFLTAINNGNRDGTDCKLQLPEAFIGGFFFQTTDAGNLLTGTKNTGADINAINDTTPAGTQNYIFGVTSSAVLNEKKLTPQVVCKEGRRSKVTEGVNTFRLSSAVIAPADMLTIALTPADSKGKASDGVIQMLSPTQDDATNGSGFVVVATNALGADASLTFAVDDGGAGLPIVTSVCETDAAGVCKATASASVTFNSVFQELRTFAAFVTATDVIRFKPGVNRLFLTFKDSDGVLRGGSSVAIRSDYDPDL